MNNDLISREALKEEIYNDKELSHWLNDSLMLKVFKYIDNAPTVEVSGLPKIYYDRGFIAGYEKAITERAQGEWVEVTRRISDSETATYWECSICKEHDRKDGKSKFCCECGAKMKGGAET